MIDFNNRDLFTLFTHPDSGVTFHILTRKVAPLQQGFYFVNDSNNGFFRGCASTVHFMNRDSGKIIVLAEHAECTDYAGRHYHIDPHPRFCCNDQYVVFTTRVRGEVDVAIVPTEDLLNHTS